MLGQNSRFHHIENNFTKILAFENAPLIQCGFGTFPHTEIAGLEVKDMPALQTKSGKTTCYTFSMCPENMLKIAYVAHRAKGRKSEKGAYQRMCSKSRLKKIAKYISNGGNFPTNIVLNIEKPKHVQFYPGEQKGGPEGAKIGTLTLSPTYGSVWVIDGQHRLFAYSGHKRAASSYLNVLAFEGLTKEQQAKLFVDINHEQKSVKSNLLDELWADLHWESKDDETRTRAVIARAIRELNEDSQSPFYGCIQLADDSMTDQRCISLTSVTSALAKANLYLVHSKRDAVEQNAFWASSNEAMLARTKSALNGWFKIIKDKSNGWWNAGRGSGGGLAMNNGVTACVNVLKDVITHLEANNIKLFELHDHQLTEILQPYANALGTALGNWSDERRIEFRGWVGGVGQDKGTMTFNEEIHKCIPEFEPPGLKDYIEARDAGTRTQAFEQISQIEKILKDSVFPILKRKFKDNPKRDAWWWSGVNPNTIDKVTKKINDSRGEEGDREDNFDFIDYHTTIIKNWDVFGKVFAYGSGNNQKTQTAWLVEINTIRKFTDHDKGRYPSLEQVRKLREYNSWLQSQIKNIPKSVPVVS